VLDLDKVKRIHFIGIGGVGMSALAYVLIKRGYMVSGSDAKSSFIATKLAKEGAIIFIGHAACQVEGAEAVVVSSAIHQDNPELVEAKARQIPVLHRSDVLAYLMNKHQGIAVAGAHGKTTTSSMLACITHEADVDPTVVVGGIVPSLGGNALNGKSDIVVAEADESDGSFLKFKPFYAVITNIENDHLDHYGSEEKIQEAFAQFVENIKDKGKAILCFDNAKIKELAEKTTKSFISYALDDPKADYTAKNIEFGPDGTHFDVYHKEEKIGTAHLVVPGRHNVLNALGAIATSQLMNIPLDRVLTSLEKFTGAQRRFETKGKVKGIWVVDDYAHHPTEIRVTLAAGKQTKPKRLICVFQPHRYTRTKLLLNEFATCFKDADELILADIYPASEEPIPGIDTPLLMKTIQEATGQKVTYLPTFEQIEKYLIENVQPGDLVMTVGAGDGYRIAENLVKALEGARAMNKDTKIAVVMGGPSKEREISFMTGNAILDALKSKGYNAVAIDLDPKNFANQLQDNGIQIVFNAIHGLYGEDGRMQSVLEMLGIPYTGSGVLSSAISMDKVYSKRMFEAMHVPTAKCIYLDKKDNLDWVAEVEKNFTLPVVVKPAAQGSSIGVTIVKDKAALTKALDEAFSYGDEVLVEAFFQGKEVAAGVMMTDKGVVPMPLVLIEPHSGSYDFHSKYTKGATTYTCPAPFSKEITEKLQAIAVAAYKSLGCNGVARADLLLADNGDAVALEINSIPGMTATSLIPKAAAAMGITFPDLCEMILNGAK